MACPAVVAAGWGMQLSKPAAVKGRNCREKEWRYSETVFVYLLRSPEIDSQPDGPVRQPYLSYWPDRPHKLAKSIPRNRFRGSINVYKYGLSFQNRQLLKGEKLQRERVAARNTAAVHCTVYTAADIHF